MLDSTKTRIEEIKKTPTITDISFANEELGDEGAKLLIEALAGRKITSLNLYGSKVSGEAIKLFEPLLKDNPSLIRLHLDSNPLPLEILSTVTSLVTLSLGHGIDANNLPTLVEIIKKNPKLLYVNLDNNLLTAEGIKLLGDGFQNRAGKLTLSLNNCGLTLSDLKPLIPQISVDATSVLQINQKNYQKDTLENAIHFFEIEKRLQSQEESHAQQIQKMTAEIADLKTKIKTGEDFLNDMLFRAAETGNVDLMKAAFNMGANVNATNSKGETALHTSTGAGNLETTKLLLDKRPQLFTTADKTDQRTPIQTIAANGKSEELVRLYEQGKNIPGFGDNPTEINKLYRFATKEAAVFLANHRLWESAKTNALEAAKEAIAHGANVNEIESVTKETSLHKAVYGKHVEMVDYLIRQGANLEIKNSHGETALETTISQEIITVFANHELLKATLSGSKDHALKALEKGADINGARDDKKATVLHLAAEKGNAELVRLFLDENADIRMQDEQGQIPLHKAALKGDKQTIKLLVNRHAKDKVDIKIKDSKDKTPFDLAEVVDKNLALYMVQKYGALKHAYKSWQEPLSLNQSLGFFSENSNTTAISSPVTVEQKADSDKKSDENPVYWTPTLSNH